MKEAATIGTEGLGNLPVFSLDAIAEAKAMGVGYYVLSAEEIRAASAFAEANGVTLIEALAECVRMVREHGPRAFLDSYAPTSH